MPDANEEKSSKISVADWLNKVGYPLEFRTANVFKKYGFEVHQGQYIRDLQSKPREIDVVASVTDRQEDSTWVRVEYIVECKWSGENPCVIFSSPDQAISYETCVRQTTASETGEAITWMIARNDDLRRLKTFSTPFRPGFMGKQVVTKGGQDAFYNALQSVTSASSNLASTYNLTVMSAPRNLQQAVVVFPIIVVKGDLYEVYFDTTRQEMTVEQVKQSRIHWRGADARAHGITVDVVTPDELEMFVQTRYEEAKVLLKGMRHYLSQIKQSFDERSLSPLEIDRTTNLPHILEWLRQLEMQEENSRRVTDSLNQQSS